MVNAAPSTRHFYRNLFFKFIKKIVKQCLLIKKYIINMEEIKQGKMSYAKKHIIVECINTIKLCLLLTT